MASPIVEGRDLLVRLWVELLLLWVKSSQLMCFGHLIRMPLGCLPLEVVQACQNGRRPCYRPRAHWRDNIYPIWPGITLGSPRRGWKVLLGRGTCGIPSLAYWMTPGKWKIMDGWSHIKKEELISEWEIKVLKCNMSVKTFVSYVCIWLPFYLFFIALISVPVSCLVFLLLSLSAYVFSLSLNFVVLDLQDIVRHGA